MSETEQNRTAQEEPHRGPGRPLKFTDPAEFERKVGEYFTWAAENDKPLTIERLCVFLDCTKPCLYDTMRRGGGFSDSIEKAVQKIEASKAERLQTQAAVAGTIFDLKNNHGWKDQKDIVSDGKPLQGSTINIIAPAGAKEVVNGVGPEVNT